MREYSRKKKHNKIISLMLSIMMLLNLAVISEGPSFAAHPDYFFSGITVEKNGTEIGALTENLEHGDTVVLKFDWEISNGFLAADSLSLTQTLPEVVDWSVMAKQDLIGPGGADSEYGTYEIVDAGGGLYNLVITFGARVDAESNVKGQVGLEVELNTSYKNIDLPYKWSTAINGNAATEMSFNVSPVGGAVLSKTGDRIGTSEEIKWTLDFNTGLDVLVNPIITDEYSSLVEYKENSLVITELNVTSQGDVTLGDVVADVNTVLSEAVSSTDAGPGLTTGLGGEVLFKLLDTNKAYRLEYITSIDPDKIDYNETDFVYGNRAKLNEESFLPQVNVNISRGSLIDKVGALTQNYNADAIDWTININNAGYSLDNVFVEDTLPTGLTQRDVVVKDTSDNPLVLNTDYDIIGPVGGETFTFAVKFLNSIDQEYIITYTTDIDNDLRKTQSDQVSFTNAAKLRHSLGQAVPKDGQPTVAVKLGRVFYKRGEGSIGYNAEKYIDWEIYVNLGEASLGADDTVIDIFSNNEYLDVSGDNIVVEELTLDHTKDFDPDENNVVTKLNELITNKVAFAGFTVIYKNEDTSVLDTNGTINKFELKFNSQVEKAYKISYRTIIQDPNTTTFINDGSIGTYGSPVTVSPTIANVYKKERVGNGIDYLTNKINWQLTVNPIKEKVQGLTISDSIPADQYLSLADFNTIKILIDGSDMDVNDYSITPVLSTLNIKGVDTDVVTSFEINYLKDVNNGVYTVEYNTTINPNTSGNNLSYTNTATFDWTGNGGGPLDKSAVPNLVDMAKTNGQKTGGFDDVNDKMINWKVDINYFSKTMTDVTLSDSLPEGLVLVPGSVKVYDYVLLANGSINVDESAVSSKDYSITENNNALEIVFNGVHESPYEIQYATMLDGISKNKYNNIASLSNGESFSYEVTYNNYDKFISKTSSRNGTSSVDFSVTINESRSTIENLVIKDTLSQGLEIVLSSFEISEVGQEFADYFDVTIEAKNLITEPTVLVLTAKNTAVIDDKFTVTYTANIIEEEVIAKKVSNSISLTGDSVDFGFKTDTVEESFTSIQGFGTGSGEVGSFTLTKVDKDDNTIKLQGAEYELKRGSKVLGTLTTDINGEITVNNLLYLEHTLTETKAPVGYELDSTPYDFTINSATKTFTLENEKNRTLKIKKVDSANDTNLLSGAVFEVYDNNNVLLATLTTDHTGYAEKILGIGDYRIKEITAPSGYYLNDAEINVTIDTSADTFEVVFENDRRPTSTPNVDPKPDTEEPEAEEPDTEEPDTEEPEAEEPRPDGEFTTVEDEPISGNIPVPEGKTPEVKTPPKNGTIVVNPDGSFIYTPNPGFSGEDDVLITDGDDDYYITFNIEPTPLGAPELPQTGVSSRMIFTVVGILLMLIGLVMTRKKKLMV